MDKLVLAIVSDVFFYTKLRDALRPQGYRLERARTQEEVVQKAAGLQPVAVVLNMSEEALDPFRALEQIRGDARVKALPVLAFANHEEVETWRRAKELGVTKIVSRNEFSSRLRELIEEVVSPQPSAISSEKKLKAES
jgi:PleD family two-component response regulator